MKQLLFVWVFLAASCSFVLAQTSEPKFDFYSRAPYRENVPRPQTLLRYDTGDFHTTYAQMEAVINAIAKAAPDRVRIYDIGETNEHRMQHIVAISSPENINRLDEIKGNLARLTDPRTTDSAAANQIIANTPIACWMAYTIHGNESSSFETMMQVVYQLAASDEPATLEILKNSVALIVTGENPDGHERFATWYNSVAIGDANRSALEHREPWSVYGRLSHYRFDLNRDNVSMSQKETQNLVKAYLEWNPQVAADHHGQPAQYFFPPTALPINPNLPAAQKVKWEGIFGRANAAQFESRLWDYYIRDVFDFFYPGYWDIYPAFNGATGMTYETDGGGPKGLRWTREDGTISTFRNSIAKHFVTSMTTLETAAKNRAERLRDFYDFRRTAIEEARVEPMKRIVILPDKDPVKAAELIEILRRSKIEIKVAGSNFRSTVAHSYDSKKSVAATKDFAAGAYIIDLAQPQKRLIKALLEQDTPQDREFIDDETGKFKRNELRGKSVAREDYRFYDITAWSMPLAFGVDAFWTEDAAPVSGANPVTDEYLANAKTGRIAGGRAAYAYVFPYETDSAAILAYRLQKEGFRVNVATKQLNAAGRDWRPGTFVVRLSRNDEKVHEAIARLAKELGVVVTPINSGFQDAGDTGIGGQNVASLKLPRIAIAADEGVDQTSYGSIWWTLDRYNVAFTPMTFNNLRSGNLQDYNVVIIPDGAPSRYSAVLNGLKDWINNGGTVICVKGAAVAAAVKEVGLTSSRLVGSDNDEQKPPPVEESKRAEAEAAPSPSPSPKPAGNKRTSTANIPADASPNAIPQPLSSDKADYSAPILPPIASPSANAGKVPEGVPGAIMRGTIDRTTYLTYGLQAQETVPVLLSSGYFFRPSKEGTNAVVFDSNPKQPLTMSGFVWEGNTEKLLKGTVYVIDEPTGRGHVILFAEEPFFRGIFRSTSRIFFNSMILAPSN
ncbi:MAG: M14 family zinc carboxypeptidase [Pyrinomonadaceae bacterium]